MKRGVGYIGRAMDAGLRKEMIATVELIKGAAAADMAAHLIDSGAVDERHARHYIVWQRYRHMLSTTTRTPNDIMQDLVVMVGYDFRTVRRVIKKMTAAVPT